MGLIHKPSWIAPQIGTPAIHVVLYSRGEMYRLIIVVALLFSPALRGQSPINLIEEVESLVWTYDEEKRPEQDSVEVWRLQDGVFHLTGQGNGSLRFPSAEKDLHLVLEFKWGERTYGEWADTARRASIGFGGAIVGLRESMSGDILAGKNGTLINPKSKAHDPAEKNIRGWHTHANSIEAPFGQWNRIEAIIKGPNLKVILNGELVNETTVDWTDRQGVSLDSIFAELYIRRWEIYPLNSFDEPWQPDTASTDTGYTATGESILPREFPLSAEDSLAQWHVDGDYELQLIAAEPLISDPVDVSWDHRGRMYVAEMRDYPLPAEHGESLSRIRILTDENEDGIMDRSSIWADELDNVQGLVPFRDGFIVTTRKQILFIKDTDGDDRADHRETLSQSNEPRHNQLQVSSPRWGLDNQIYLNNGLDLKEIYPVDQPDEVTKISKTNIRLDPRSGRIEPVSGYGQFGATQDDFGRRFFCSNRNPTMMAVMPLAFVKRNPFAGIASGHEDIAPAGEGAKVYPMEMSHTTSVAHAGTHTAACGLAVYRGDAIPTLKGNVFVCEPTAQLITRSVIEDNGSSLRATRVGEKRDFLVSGDEWSRPVNLRNGPDGALYICDMYRRFIDHARFFPEAFSESHYMRAGFDHGRIYRLVDKSKAIDRKIVGLPDGSGDLVALLESENAWHRIHAQRLLVERGDQTVVPKLKEMLNRSANPAGRLHAFWTLKGLDALTDQLVGRALKDTSSQVVENAIAEASLQKHGETLRLILKNGRGRASLMAALALGDDPSLSVTNLFQTTLHNTPEGADPWMQKAVLSGSENRAGVILAHMLDHPIQVVTGSGIGGGRPKMYREFAAAVAARGEPSELAILLSSLASVESDEYRFSVAQGLSDGLKKSTLKTKSLAAFIERPPEECSNLIEGLKATVDSAIEIAAGDDQPLAARLAAMPLASQRDLADLLPVVEKLIVPTQPKEIQEAGALLLSRFSRNNNEVSEFFFSRWKTLPPAVRRAAITVLTSSNGNAKLVMHQMKEGLISPAMMSPMKRWGYGRSADEEIKALAMELFGKASSDRAGIVEEFQVGLSQHVPDLAKGKLALQKGTCLICHRIGGKGVAVGPDLADVRAKPVAALLSDILDPNRAVEERWVAYLVETKQGQILSGLIESEDEASVVLRVPGGLSQTVARSEITKMESTGMSLMPVGLEAALSKEEVADIIGVLKAH